MQLSNTLIYTLLALLATLQVNGQQQEQQDLNAKQSQSLTSMDAAKSSDSQHQQEAAKTSNRGGRMLDLDVLSGDMAKSEKDAMSISGNRKSRLLSEENPKNPEARQLGYNRPKQNNKKSGPKMEIKGFIPIISLEHGANKGGKQFDASSLLGGQGEDHEEDHQAESTVEASEAQAQLEQSNSNGLEYEGQQQQPADLKQQLMANYGHQTSLGHASFGAPTEMSGENDAARANRKLLGNSGGLLAGPKRLVNSIVQGGPLSPSNEPPSDCMCVPFFQCKNGYLNEAQLSKSQIAQIMGSHINPTIPMQLQHQHQFLQPSRPMTTHLYPHQVPRSLNDPGLQQQVQQQQPQKYTQYQEPTQVQQQPQYQQQAGLNAAEQQLVMNQIYEQLGKTLTNQNDATAIQQQQQQAQNYDPQLMAQLMANYGQVDERSNSNSNTSDDATQGRSMLSNLGIKRSSALSSQRCGIMRTCCKLPPSMTQLQYLRPHHQQPHPQHVMQEQQFQHLVAQPAPMPSFQQQLASASNQMHHLRPPQSARLQRPIIQPYQQQAQQPPYGPATSLVEQPTQEYQVLKPNQYLQQQHQQPKGSFMAGRCGTREVLGIAGRVQNANPAPGSESLSDFGEFPAHAAILRRISQADSLFVCSAVLVSGQWLATAAHCVRKLRPEELKIRLGEWDVSKDDEFYPYFETNVREIIVHPEFQPSSLANDIALLRLERAIEGQDQQLPHISPACLASQDEIGSLVGQRCWLAGWGKNAFGQMGNFQSQLKKVDLPIVARQECEFALRHQTKLGRSFRLHQSDICAGGEGGKDACEGDGGAGLYCLDPSTQLAKVVGLVSWGVGCGQVGVPGVYTSIGQMQGWIESVVVASGEDNLYLDRSVISERTINGTLATSTSMKQNSPAEIEGEARSMPLETTSSTTTMTPKAETVKDGQNKTQR